MIFFEFTIDDIIIHTRIVLITPYDLCSTIRDAVIAFIIRPTGAKKNSAVSNSIFFSDHGVSIVIAYNVIFSNGS